VTITDGEYLRGRLLIEDVTELLNTNQAAIRKQLSRGRFPEPHTDPRGGPRFWRRPEIFRHALAQGGEAAQNVPRIFTRTAAPNPARFISNTTFVSGFHHLHLLTWLPSDGAGFVALAHPLGAKPHKDVMRDLFNQDDKLSAVAVVRDDMSIGPHEMEVSLDIWERGKEKSNLGSWSDLLQLLATPLPYWSRGLRQRPAMLAWRPGAPAVSLTPTDEHLDTNDIAALLEDVTDARAARVLRSVIYEIESKEVSGAEQDLKLRPPFPGFFHAATVAQVSEVAADVQDADLSALLHLTGLPQAKALTALEAWDAWDGIAPYLNTRQQVRPGLTGLAAEWAQRLQPVAGPETRAEVEGAEELGHLYLKTRQAVGGAEEAHCLRDPLHPDLWVIRVGATYFYNVPPAMPATGTLQDVAIAEDDYEVTAFFRDSSGTVWPVPAGHGDFNVGYDGSGPYTLATVLHALAQDAAADVRSRDRGLPEAGSWLMRQLTSPTGARFFTLAEMAA